MSRVQLAPNDARHVLIAVNPKAGARSRQELVEELRAALERQDFTTGIVSSRDEITHSAAKYLAKGELRALVCAGGDGTVAFAANATAPGTPLAVLPLGTENLLAKYLGIRQDVSQLTETIATGWTCRFDAGWASAPQESSALETASDARSPNTAPVEAADEPPQEGRLFTLMAGLGFDADVVKQVHENRTGHIRHLSYAKPIWSTIRRYRYPELRVYCSAESHLAHPDGDPQLDQRLDNREVASGENPESKNIEWSIADPNIGGWGEPIRARWVFVANLPRYAGNLQIVPDANGLDGMLDVCTFKGGSIWKGLQYFGAVLLGRHRKWSSEVQTVRTTRVLLEADEPVSYQLDGDYGGELPLEIRVLPERLTLLTPRTWLEEAGLDCPGIEVSERPQRPQPNIENES